VTEQPTTQPGASYATRRGFGAITRGEGPVRRFRNDLRDEQAAAEYAAATA